MKLFKPYNPFYQALRLKHLLNKINNRHKLHFNNNNNRLKHYNKYKPLLKTRLKPLGLYHLN